MNIKEILIVFWEVKPNNNNNKKVKLCLKKKKTSYIWCLLGTLESLRLFQSSKQVRLFVPVLAASDGCVLPGHRGRRVMKNGDLTACTGSFHLPPCSHLLLSEIHQVSTVLMVAPTKTVKTYQKKILRNGGKNIQKNYTKKATMTGITIMAWSLT